MTTVKGLRNEILWKVRVPVICDYEDPKLGAVHETTFRGVSAKDLDSLIAAAKEEERKRLEALARDGGYFNELGQEVPFPYDLETRLAKAGEEGAEQEREKIRKEGELCFNNSGKAIYIVLASALAPDTKEKK
jgi:hypothetical protein